jgi:hypothetical protein
MRGGTPSRSIFAESSILSGILIYRFSLLANTFWLLKSSSKIASSAAIPDLEKTQGYIIAISSIGAQLRFPGGSDGCITKHAVNRLVEFIALGKILISLIFLFRFRENR